MFTTTYVKNIEMIRLGFERSLIISNKNALITTYNLNGLERYVSYRDHN